MIQGGVIKGSNQNCAENKPPWGYDGDVMEDYINL